MGKRAPANPDKFEEASTWFRARTPVTRPEWDVMSKAARRQAFTVAGTQQLKVVQTVFDEISKSIDKGTPLSEFKKALKLKLGAEFTKQNSTTLTTAFINANQTAYNTGRYYQLNDPAVTDALPYQMFDAVLDDHTTEICQHCNATIRRHDDPWWLTHWPPLHHRCRSTVRAITASMAQRMGGITKELPRPAIHDDWGLAPPLRVGEVWTPDPAKYDGAAFGQYQRKQARMAANDNARKAAPVEHDPKHWEQHYRSQGFTDSAGTLAHGRAMEERGGAMTLQDLSAGVAELKKAGLLAEDPYGREQRHTVDVLLSGNTKFKTVEDAVKHLIAELDLEAANDLKLAAALVQHAKTISAATIEFPAAVTRGLDAGAARTANLVIDKAARVYSAIADKSLSIAEGHEFHANEQARASISLSRKVINVGANSGRALKERMLQDTLHEVGHSIEDLNPTALRRAKDMLEVRTRGESSVRMVDLKPGAGYRDDETVKQDKLFHPYMGKHYEGATEITSMAVQHMHDVVKLRELFEADPESFRFILGQLANK